MIFNKKLNIFLIQICILTLQVKGSCLGIAQDNQQFCHVTEKINLDDKAANVSKKDVKPKAVLQSLPKTSKNISLHEHLSSELYLESKLINIAIQKLLELRKLNKIERMEVEGVTSKDKRNRSTISRPIALNESNSVDRLLKKRSLSEMRANLPIKRNTKMQKKLKLHSFQPRSGYFLD